MSITVNGEARRCCARSLLLCTQSSTQQHQGGGCGIGKPSILLKLASPPALQGYSKGKRVAFAERGAWNINFAPYPTQNSYSAAEGPQIDWYSATQLVSWYGEALARSVDNREMFFTLHLAWATQKRQTGGPTFPIINDEIPVKWNS